MTVWLKRCWVFLVSPLLMCAVLAACQSANKEAAPVDNSGSAPADKPARDGVPEPTGDNADDDVSAGVSATPDAVPTPPAALPSLDLATRFPASESVLKRSAAVQLLPNSVVWTAVVDGQKAIDALELASVLADGRAMSGIASATALLSAQIQAALQTTNGLVGLAQTLDGTWIIFAEVNDPNAVLTLFESYAGVKSEPEDSRLPNVIIGRAAEHRLVFMDNNVFMLLSLDKRATADQVARSFGAATNLGSQPRFAEAVERLQYGPLAAVWVDIQRMREQTFAPIEDKLTKIDRAMTADNGGGPEDPRLGMKRQLAGIRAGLDAVWGDVGTITVGFDKGTSGLDMVVDVALARSAGLVAVDQHLPLLSVWTEPLAMSFGVDPRTLPKLAASVFTSTTEPALRAAIGELGLNVDQDVLTALTGQVAVGLAPTFHPLLADIELQRFDGALTLQLSPDAPLDDVWNAVTSGLSARADTTVSDDGNHIQVNIGDTASLNIERMGTLLSVWSGPMGAEPMAGQPHRLAADGGPAAHGTLNGFDGMLGRVDLRLGELRLSSSTLRPDPRDAICRPNNDTLVAKDPAAKDAYCALLDEVRALAAKDAERRNAAASSLFDGLVVHATLAAGDGQNIRAYGGVYTDGTSVSALLDTLLAGLPGPGDADFDALSEQRDALDSARDALELERN